MFYSFILHSIVSSYLYGLSSKDRVIIKNSTIFLALYNLNSNSFVGFIPHLFRINNSVFSQYTKPFWEGSSFVSKFISSSLFSFQFYISILVFIICTAFLGHLLSINNSVISQSITIFLLRILLCLHIHIFILFYFQFFLSIFIFII